MHKQHKMFMHVFIQVKSLLKKPLHDPAQDLHRKGRTVQSYYLLWECLTELQRVKTKVKYTWAKFLISECTFLESVLLGGTVSKE